MDSIAIAASAGLRARMEALDMLSNNLANATTGGYKLDREFYSLFQSETDGYVDPGLQGTTLPVIQKKWTDFKQGLLQPTGNPLDAALAGPGFFAVNGPSGPLYTRNGAFKLSSSGVLTTQDGYPVRGTGGAPIQTETQEPLNISSNGVVQQGGNVLGQIEIVDFANPEVLDKTGSSYFRNTDPTAKPVVAAETTVETGRIEASNVVPAESAVRLVELMRQYEMLQKAVLTAAEMNKKTLDEVARVGG